MSDEPKNCDGCGKAFKQGAYGPDCVKTDIAPDVSVSVCTGRYRHSPSSVCLLKARQKKSVCPGCGAEDTEVGSICEECTANIDRGKSAQGQGGVDWVAIDQRKIFGPYVSTVGEDDEEVVEQLAVQLITAVAGERRWCKGFPEVGGTRGRMIPKKVSSYDGIHGGMLFVEMSKAQADALEAFVSGLQKVGDLQRRIGYDEGNSLLHKLASGKVRMDEYDDRSVTNGRKGAEEEE